MSRPSWPGEEFSGTEDKERNDAGYMMQDVRRLLATGSCQLENPKSEARNPKQIQNSNVKCPKQEPQR